MRLLTFPFIDHKRTQKIFRSIGITCLHGTQYIKTTIILLYSILASALVCVESFRYPSIFFVRKYIIMSMFRFGKYSSKLMGKWNNLWHSYCFIIYYEVHIHSSLSTGLVYEYLVSPSYGKKSPDNEQFGGWIGPTIHCIGEI